MSSPPETDREYAHLLAIGSFDPSEMTQLFGIEPNDSWKTGDCFERNGHNFKRRNSVWKLDSGLDDTAILNDHIAAFINRLRSSKVGLLEARTKAKLQIVCVSCRYQSFNFQLNFELQVEATALGIGFEFFAYGFGDYHEEMMELREQVLPMS